MVSLTFPKPNEGVAVLVDIDKCIGCRACQVACKDWNGRPAVKTEFAGSLTLPKWLTAEDWKVVFFYEGKTGKKLMTPAGEVTFSQFELAPLPYNCMHCAAAPCARACPVGAIKVTGEGAVVINKEECIGCGYCEAACPYDVPKKGSDGRYYKCTFCVDRIQNGRAPACVEVCPTNVFTFGPASEVIAKAREEQRRGRYVYGLEVNDYVGGSVRWIYVTSDRRAFAVKQHFSNASPRAAQQIREVLKPLTLYGGALLAVGLTIAGIAAWRQRRKEEKEEAGTK
ncbi:4Fe-4S dicluster domain-containing protein [Pyrobaculum aerophilum]|uniref:4Fe-4S dicluster domain-containing protein n=1 Tax=Pyrobaculum aerophilum TaxID=13773 RepID=A0A832W5G4_9CREN|nr:MULTISPECIES: 4Fe-4S dicluster domain-containing protein [Pyrobaculum]MCX8137224.1 4Fe-4S dicluster domain-containing protein [Pyrobaculum aerophilum]HII47964.1 4Fe-4S dicluster domain-containing protein [Pyrobaculum aerophilum]